MSLGKILALTAAFLLAIIGFAVLFKDREEPLSSYGLSTYPVTTTSIKEPIEISLEPEVVKEEVLALPVVPVYVQKPEKPIVVEKKIVPPPPLPEANRIQELFNTTGKKLPFVETITYKSRVAWQKGRPAWLSDYASYYGTSRHFIARSLNGGPDYFKQDVAEGNKFNVFKQDYPLEFLLLIDASRCKMWLYAIAGDSHEKILLKTYPVSLGRSDSSSASGLLTPLGKYKLGSRIAIYKPKVMGLYKNQKTEMIQVFGTRWIPFEVAVGDTTAPAKGLGLHGVPFVANKKGELEEDLSSLGKFESDGCIRFAKDDIEEIYAIVITKPAYVELVKDILKQ